MSDLPDFVQDGSRKLYLRELDPGDMLDLIEAAGGTADSGAWMRYAVGVCSVSKIDEMPLPMPRKKEAVKANARLLGNSGVMAVFAVIYPTVPIKDEGEPDAEIDATKN